MAELSICFLGTGSINRRYVRIVHKLAPKAVLSVASRDLTRAKLFRSQFNLKDAFGSYEEAIKSSYTTIVVGVPPRSHLELAKQILEQGKHGLIEKPIFQSLQEFSSIWRMLSESKGVVMVAENLFFAPFQRLLKNILKKEDLGNPLYFDLNRPGRSQPKGWRSDPAEMPLGALHEGGVHWIRRLLDLTSVYATDPGNDVLGVRALVPKTKLTDTPGEDTMLVTARHSSGIVSRLFHSWAIPWRMPLFDVSKIIFDRSSLYFDARGIYGRLYGNKRRFLWPCVRDASGYGAMWKHFLDCIRNDSKPELSMKTIYRDFAYMDAAYRSAKTGNEEIPKGINQL